MKTKILFFIFLLLIWNIYTFAEVNSDKLLHIEDFNYIGWFRIPTGHFWDSRTDYSDWRIAINSKKNSIYLSSHSHQNYLWEFPMANLVKSNNLSDLEITSGATQNFTDIFSRVDRWDINAIWERIGWMKMINWELMVHWYGYYDSSGNIDDTTLIIRNPNDLKNSNIDWFFKFEWATHLVDWISEVPQEWKEKLGWNYISWWSSQKPIHSRSSMWPSAFVFNSWDVIWNNETWWDIDTQKLLDFNLSHVIANNEKGWLPYSDDWNGKWDWYNSTWNNDMWTSSAGAVYWFIVPNTSTYAVFWNISMIDSGGWYKITQSNWNLCWGYCENDPLDHHNYYWFFDVNDLLEVKKWNKLPYEVKPYEYWRFHMPFDIKNWWSSNKLMWSADYDSEKWILYFGLPGTDRLQWTYSVNPVIVAYKISSNDDIIDNNNYSYLDTNWYISTNNVILNLSEKIDYIIIKKNKENKNTVVNYRNSIIIELEKYLYPKNLSSKFKKILLRRSLNKYIKLFVKELSK